MSTLLIRLSGPMQGWGTRSRFTVRDTEREPSKSGVVGLLACALGLPRDSPRVAELATLRMGVRIDREGVLERDFHTALNVRKASGGKGGTVVSHRYYLADACFLVGLEGDDGLLDEIDEALQRPKWPLFLGRKSFVPGEPVRLASGHGRFEGSVEDALGLERPGEACPWLPDLHALERGLPLPLRRPERLRLVLTTDDHRGEPRDDQPVSFEPRRFTVRYVATSFVALPDPRAGEPAAAADTTLAGAD